MIWAERIQLLMQMYPLKPTFKSKTVFYCPAFSANRYIDSTWAVISFGKLDQQLTNQNLSSHFSGKPFKSFEYDFEAGYR